MGDEPRVYEEAEGLSGQLLVALRALRVDRLERRQEISLEARNAHVCAPPATTLELERHPGRRRWLREAPTRQVQQSGVPDGPHGKCKIAATCHGARDACSAVAYFSKKICQFPPRPALTPQARFVEADQTESVWGLSLLGDDDYD
jgi:hypothetical protein